MLLTMYWFEIFLTFYKATQAFNSLPNNNIFDMIKLKTFAVNKLNVAIVMNSLFDRVESTLGKGENAGYQHFLLFP